MNKKEFKTKDVIVLRNKMMGEFDGDDFYYFEGDIINFGSNMHLLKKDLTNKGYSGDTMDVMEVWRTRPEKLKYEKVYDRKEENKTFSITTKGLNELYKKHDVCESVQRDVKSKLTEIE